MITEKEYLEAKKLIAEYELSNGIKPVVIKSLPSDEEINKEMMSSYKLGFGEKLTREKQSARYGFISGAKWMREELSKRGNVL